MMSEYLETLKQPAFRWLFSSIIFSNLATSIANISLIWLAYNAFNSPLVISVVLGALQLPSLFIGPFLGGLLDKLPKIQLMILGNFINALVFIFLIFNPLIRGPHLIIFIGLLILSGAMKPLLIGGDSMIIQDIFPHSSIRVPANALTTMSFDLTYIAGSLLSGLVIALGYGVKVYLIVGILYAMVVLCLMRIKKHISQRKGVTSSVSFWHNLKDAGLIILKNSELSIVLLMDFLWNMLLWAGLTVLLPVLVKHDLGASAQVYGMLESMTSIGIVVGSFLIGQLTLHKQKLVISVVGAIAVHGLLFASLGLIGQLWAVAVLLIMIGLIVSPALIYKVTFYQQTFDQIARGTLFTIAGTITAASYSLGIALTSALATTFPVHIGIIFELYGVIILIIAGGVMFKLRKR